MARSTILLIILAAAAAAEHVREFAVRENARAGTIVGHLGDDVPDAAPRYTIVPVPGSAVYEDLEINLDTGEIRTRVSLDREKRDHYAMVAIPASGENIKVLVKVLDENDNAPMFPTPVMHVEFSENTPRDVKRKLNPAKDDDLGIFNTQRYNIVSGNTENAFRLSSHRERDGVLYLDLQINGFLDRETTDHYELVIEAFDGGAPPLRGTMTVNITILDVNDNPPIFAKTSYSATIPENATVGTTVLKVSAIDADLEENGQIEYSINRRQSDKENMFKIDPVTGDITVNKALDFETKELHELVVVARDKGAQPLETTAFVSILVTDVNDNQPTINVIFLSDDTEPKISEAAQVNDYAARISVHDPDSKTEYSNVNVTLEGGDGYFRLQTNDNIIYFIVVALPLDREKQSSYTLKIIATDKGSPPLHATRVITLKVTDVNDNTPVFSANEYTVEVPESAALGTPVFQVSATDLDEGENADIRYSLLQNPQSEWFAIDERSGLVTVRSRVACETNPAPRLTVVASDRGIPSLSSTAVLVVTVLDVNDNEPIFDQSFYNVTVPENEAIGSCILKISAMDPDCGVNSIVNYTLGSTSAKSQFIIRRDTGELCVADTLDYEASSEIELPIVATDRGGLSTIAMVKIQLIDINDNVPTFNTADYSVTLKEGRIPSKDPIVAVSATDKDSDRFGTVSYRIVGGNVNEIFRIERHTGEIFVAKPNLINKDLKFNLKVSAVDGGGASSNQPAYVRISVMKAELGSVFDRAIYNFRVKEDLKIGSVVGVIKSNNNKGSRVRNYIIASGDPENHFKVQFSTGAITTTRHLDRESKSLHLLNIQAVTDNSDFYDQTQVFVIIEDVNDNAPEFGLNTVRVSVAESAHIGSMVYAARATDLDEGKNAQLTYTIASAVGPPNTFAVNLHTGIVTLLRSLDFEHLVRHTLVITAKDNGTPSLTGNLTLVIDVQDVNDNPPVFEHDHYVADILESEPVGTKVIEIQAIDKDTGNNARITYRIISESNETDNYSFEIDSSTGWILIKNPLDRERSHLHKLIVTATDNGLPPKTTSTHLTITILDANDNDPVLSKSSYEFEVEENRDAGSFVGQVSASDADIGKNAALKFSLFPTNTSFNIDSVTGVITTKEKLDREVKSSYSVFAEAKDQGTPQRSSRVPVQIKISDVNDNPPEIIDPREDVVSVREEQQPGAEVARVKAIDRDNGVNSTIKYSLLNERDSDGYSVFVIDSKTGVIRTSSVLDHEEKSIYRLTVAAADSGSPPRQTVRKLKVEVLDLNDNRPTFTSSSLSFKVREDAEIGHIVGKVSCCDKEESENFVNGDLQKYVSYLIMPLTNDYLPGTFEIDKRTGCLVVARKLDREVQDEYRLEVRALDTSASNNPQSSAINVRIEILDVNDNAPEWSQDPIMLEIYENTTIGTIVFNFTAKDKDTADNADLNYSIGMSIPSIDKIFSLDPLTGSLTLTSLLDYESLKDYWFVIQATDMAIEPKDRVSTAATIHIKILDANDNAPKFISSNKILISHNSLHSVFYQALAIDLDSGDNGKVSYFISSGNIKGYFSLESRTGKLSLAKNKKNTDITEKQHILNITATDHAVYFPKQSHMMLVLTFQESTTAPPKFAKQFYEVQINEGIRSGTFVTKVSAMSTKDDYSDLTYHIPRGIAGDKFIIDKKSGTITASSNFDREEKDYYIFPVYVSDTSLIQSSVYDVTTVSVSILDDNDNAPMFKQGSCYRLSVPENNVPDVIHTVAAIDKDIGVNGQIMYSIISGNIGNKFSIDASTGQLTAKTLDRESQSKYHLTISAYDRGVPVVLQGSCNLTIVVEDQNDNDPVFETSSYTATVFENVPVGTSVLMIKATDADSGLNGRLVYSLVNESEGVFRIDNKTGIIYTNGRFDREKQDVYNFAAVATDEGRYLARSQKVNVKVNIIDINDNKPIFTQFPYRVQIATLSPPGQNLIKVIATDVDIGINSEIFYELVDNPNSKFRINPATGILTATQSLAGENGNLIHLKVIAKDKGNPPQSSTGLIEIRVGEFYDLPSLNFKNTTYNITIPENHPYGKEIIQVTAVRSDGRRQRIIYEICGGNEQYSFEIDTRTGVIRVNNSAGLDYESFPEPKRKLTVVARTENNPVLYGYSEVTINLVDQNDNAPRFTQDQYSANVFEGNGKGEFIVQLSAKDNDQGVNARILYHIVDGNHDNAFIIEPAFSGSVKTNIVLDREIRDSYKLTVIATDEGDPQMTGTATLRINVVDVNDNQPTFPPPNVISISEGTTPGAVLTTVTANDVDTYPALKYSISQEEDKFSIDRYSGRVVLIKPLDFEEKKSHELTITASDSEHETKTILHIHVTDINDNAPVFNSVAYSSTLTDVSGSQEILTVQAKDNDSGDNSNLTYSFAEPIKGYSINPITGVVSVNYTDISTNQKEVQLIAVATDQGNPKKSATAAVRINSGATSDIRPFIGQDSYRITVKENTERGSSLLKLGDIHDVIKKHKIIFQIISGNEGGFFEITNDGSLILINNLDRESQDTYVLGLAVLDQGNMFSYSQNKTAITVHVSVSDCNDNAPQFATQDFELNISEDINIGHTLTQLSTSDSDLYGSSNAEVSFTITSGDDEKLFFINTKTGVLTVNKSLDYDTGNTEYKLVIVACDHGIPSLCNAAYLKIALLDENDNMPTFPVTEYFESIGENERIGSSVFIARATDLDRGKFGKLEYSIIPTTYGNNEDSLKMFQIDTTSGLVSSNAVFDYEQKNKYELIIKATDIGGKSSTVRVRIDIESRDEFYPQFTQKTYNFIVPLSGYLPTGYVIGRVVATDRDKGIDGRIAYQLSTLHSYFKINRTTGEITVKKRADSITTLFGSEKSISFVVTASSGRQGSLTNKTAVEIKPDASAVYSNINQDINYASSEGLSDWALGLLISFIFIIIIFAAAFVLLHMKNKRHKKVNKPGLNTNGVGATNSYVDPSAFDTIPIRNTGPGNANQFAPPKYDEIPPYGPHTASSNSGAATSELSASDQSGSSGRGSAEEGEDGEDEEIRMINECPVQRNGGIRRPNDVDEDNLSDVSVHNTQEYLARLGIVDPGTAGGASTSSRRCSENNNKDPTLHHVPIDPMRMFDEDVAHENDITNLIYAKLNEVTGSDRGSSTDGTNVVDRSLALGAFPNAPRDSTGVPTQGPSMTGSLSSIVHSEEELTGSYNWDYLLDWGPQYQPLAHVFSEIARLKDDTVSLHSGNSAASSIKSKGTSISGAKNVPPPLLTTVAPRSCPAPSLACRQPPHLSPRSPISHDVPGGFSTAAAMSPSFSPSLSPLATRSPSMSPLVGPGLPPAPMSRKPQHSTLRL